MFLGDDPPLYYLEIVVRCTVIYVWTIALLRWIGGRSVTQLSLVEFLLVIALGSAVGDALFYPDVPLAQAMLVILVVVVINKVIDAAILRWDPVKRVVDGGPVEMIRDGRIVLAASMDEVGERYIEVMVPADKVNAANALQPIDQRTVFGKSVMLFDGVSRAQLSALGETRNPSVADLFVATMKGTYA